ncbi:phosphotransferase [Nocardia sp. NPDC051832]|uniref:aminoglycoside 3'-phosphotransferase n=1 Tax=Nocardia sp. NPDC051832 TaxID=3155673 RepID=UPI003439FCF3
MTVAYRFDERQRMIPVDPEGLAARVAAAEPGDFAGFRQTGIELMLLGRFEEALDHLDRALELADAGSADGLRSGEQRRISVWINLGDVYRYQGDVATAEELYSRAVDAARACAPASELLSFAVQHLGKALAEQGRLGEARTLLVEAQHLRIAEGDAELIESTRVALETLEQLPIPLPPAIVALVGETPTFSDEHEGQSGGVAFVNGSYWMKRGPRAAAEHDRLKWLQGLGIRLPDIAAFDADVLVLADAGVPSLAARGHDYDDEGEAATAVVAGAGGPSVGAIMGTLLRRLHSIPIEECPFDGRLEIALAHARRMVLEGLVDAEDFDDDNQEQTPEQVLARLHEERPEETDLVVAHGDFTSANVLEGEILIDVGALGVADRYRDLALAARDLSGHHSADEVTAFFAAYGVPEPDQRRLDYYRLLDELF